MLLRRISKKISTVKTTTGFSKSDMQRPECRIFQKSSTEKTTQNFENPTKIRRREEKKLQIVKTIQDYRNPSKIRHYNINNKKGED